MLFLDLAWQKYSKSVKKYQTPFKKFLFVDQCNYWAIFAKLEKFKIEIKKKTLIVRGVTTYQAPEGTQG